jgi:hypothetical protein
MKRKAGAKKAARTAKPAAKKPGLKRAAAKARAESAAKKPRAKPKHDALDTMIAASAQALGLTLDPAWHASIKFNLQLVLRHAALVDGFPLPDDAEPAPVFHA